MNNVLAVKAELKTSEFSLSKDGVIITKKYDNDTSSFLVQNALDFLSSEKLVCHDLSQIIVSSGPGSFTAIRAVMSMSRCLSSVFHIPVKAVSIFDVFEKKYAAEMANKNVCMIVRGNVLNEVFIKKTYASGCFFYDVINISEVKIKISDADVVFSTVHISDVCEYIFDEFVSDSSNLLLFVSNNSRGTSLKTEKITPFYFKDIYADKTKKI